MTAVKGQVYSQPKQGTVRHMAWRSMRILRVFTTATVCRATPGAQRGNVKAFIAKLVRHGYVRRQGTYHICQPGQCQQYRLVKDTGPNYPTRCERCGRPLGERCKGESDE